MSASTTARSSGTSSIRCRPTASVGTLRDYGNGRIRILGIFYYQHPFDVEAYKALTDDNPEYVAEFLGICDLMEDYQWFTTCEMPAV